MHDKRVISNQTDKSFTLVHATIDTHDGDYSCIAFIDTVKSDTSQNYTIELRPQKPTLRISSSAPTVEMNTDVNLTCITKSLNKKITYLFQRDGSNITTQNKGLNIYKVPTNKLTNTSFTCQAISDKSVSSSLSDTRSLRIVEKPVHQS
jgi:hypothetical protein